MKNTLKKKKNYENEPKRAVKTTPGKATLDTNQQQHTFHLLLEPAAVFEPTSTKTFMQLNITYRSYLAVLSYREKHPGQLRYSSIKASTAVAGASSSSNRPRIHQHNEQETNELDNYSTYVTNAQHAVYITSTHSSSQYTVRKSHPAPSNSTTTKRKLSTNFRVIA